jgi:hypothetical protein
MDIFKGLSIRTKLMIIASSLFLVTLSMGLLVFGSNGLTQENSLIQQAQTSSQADMLYVHPGEGH